MRTVRYGQFGALEAVPVVVHVYSATAEMWSMRETIVHLHSADRARHTMIVKSQCQWTPWVELEGNALRTNGAAVPCQRTAEIMPQMLEKAHASMPVSIARRCALRQLDVTADEPPPRRTLCHTIWPCSFSLHIGRYQVQSTVLPQDQLLVLFFTTSIYQPAVKISQKKTHTSRSQGAHTHTTRPQPKPSAQMRFTE